MSEKKKPAQSRLPLKKEKNSFILDLNKGLYRKNVVDKALAEDKDWIKEISKSDEYFHLRLKTSKIEDVFDWMNYLIYLHKV
ncbi:MAG: hypothetical protein AB1650_05590 [Candidatus Omnitrophota bacterium]